MFVSYINFYSFIVRYIDLFSILQAYNSIPILIRDFMISYNTTHLFIYCLTTLYDSKLYFEIYQFFYSMFSIIMALFIFIYIHFVGPFN